MSVPYVPVCASCTFSTEDDSPAAHSWSEKNSYSQGTKISFHPALLQGCSVLTCYEQLLGRLLMWHVAVPGRTDCETLSQRSP